MAGVAEEAAAVLCGEYSNNQTIKDQCRVTQVLSGSPIGDVMFVGVHFTNAILRIKVTPPPSRV